MHKSADFFEVKDTLKGRSSRASGKISFLFLLFVFTEKFCQTSRCSTNDQERCSENEQERILPWFVFQRIYIGRFIGSAHLSNIISKGGIVSECSIK
jgi:hypothetical protein